MTVVVFGAGHVTGAKIWMGYNEDLSMFDLATREAKYATDKYGQETKTFLVTNTSYAAVQAACTGCDLAVFEHSNAEAAPVKGTANRVTVYRTVKNPGDGVCLQIAQVTAKILNTIAYPVAHAANSYGNDAYGVLGRAMAAGCSDTWLAENGFHTHPATREMLSDPNVRQQIAEAKVDAMATYYGWKEVDSMELRLGATGQIVYGLQIAVKKIGYNIGAFSDMVLKDENGLPLKTGCDGKYGNTMVTVVNQIKAKYGFVQDGVVDDATYGKINQELQALQTGVPQEQYDAVVAENDALESQLATTQGQLTRSEAELSEANAYLNKYSSAVKALSELGQRP